MAAVIIWTVGVSNKITRDANAEKKSLFFDGTDDAKDSNCAKDETENGQGGEDIDDEEPGNHSGVPPVIRFIPLRVGCILDFGPIC